MAFRVLVLLAAAGVTAAYLTGISTAGGADAFFEAQLVNYTFSTSLFDVWIVTVVRAFLLVLCAAGLPFPFFAIVDAGSAGVICAKFVVLVAASALDYVVLGVALAGVVAEALAWKLVLTRIKPIYEVYEPEDLDGPGLAYHPVEYSSQSALVRKAPVRSYGSVAPQQQKQQAFSSSQNGLESAASPLLYEDMAESVDEDAFHSAEEENDATAADGTAQFRPSPLEQMPAGKSTRPVFPPGYDVELDAMKAAFPGENEIVLKRFLAARNFNVDKAVSMLQDSQKWREQFGIKGIKFEVPPIPMRGFDCFPDGNGEDAADEFRRVIYYNGSCLHKWSRDGQPIAIYTFGSTDAKGIAQNTTREELEKVVVHSLEFLAQTIIPELEQRTGPQMPAISAIVDLKGLGYRQLYMPAVFHLTGLLTLVERNYPECLGFVCVINAPAIFTTFWAIIKPFIPERSQQRIRILGSNYLEDVLELIPPENLPSHLGGLCCCRGKGGCVPYPASPGYGNPLLDDRGYTMATVPAAGVYDQPISVTREEIHRALRRHPDQKSLQIRWAFTCKTGAVRFSVLYMKDFNEAYRTAEIPLSNVVAPQEYAASPANEVTGVVSVRLAGTYILRWEAVKAKSAITYLVQ